MSSEPEKAPPAPEAGVPADTVSNKQRKRDARKAEKAAKYAQAQQKPAAKDPSPEHEKKKQKPDAEDDPSTANYGDVLPGEILPTAVPDEPWAEIGRLDKAAAGCSVLVRVTPRQSTVGGELEIQVRKLYCITRADPRLPISAQDAGWSAEEFAKAEAKFREYLSSKDIGIHTPKLISGSSEGGAAVFKLEYKNVKCACLAQSPQLHKQLAICGGFRRVLEVGDVFRAEDSNTHRHLCEFVGLDAEMEIMRHYFEICDIVDGLFVELLRHLNENWKTELEAINRQYPFEPVKYLEGILRLSYEEGIQLLKYITAILTLLYTA
ncbi:unnamed protein product [Triticum turgidum subsp. durum]|uniref:Aminoacyl-tRNA synthetase class II (D/K/N) domain-containing protein n=1 Tax=Triticum turgidum subsp. durum TaxID=4567 RepID=A0A9R1QYU9_TRITD|nr:unnamed protein product [Triticum turgidum subsp. durum]